MAEQEITHEKQTPTSAAESARETASAVRTGVESGSEAIADRLSVGASAAALGDDENAKPAFKSRGQQLDESMVARAKVQAGQEAIDADVKAKEGGIVGIAVNETGKFLRAERAPTAKEHEKSLRDLHALELDGQKVTQVRYDVRLESDGFMPKTQSADVRLFRGKNEVAAFVGLTREELEKAVGQKNLASIENCVGAHKRGQVRDEAGNLQAFSGKLEKADLSPEVGSTVGLESKAKQADSVHVTPPVAPEVAPEIAAQQAQQTSQSTPEHAEETTNSIEQDEGQEQGNNIDDEVRQNAARMWARRNAEKQDAVHSVDEFDQSPERQPLESKSKGNEIDDDDVFADRQAKPIYRPVPKEIEDAYLRVGNKFHYQSKPELQAFEDKGNKLETKSNSERVAIDLVKIAKARGWSDIVVKGTDDFRRQAWLEASAQGLNVKGYKPTEADRAMLDKRLRDMPANSVERDKPQQERTTGAQAKEAPTAKAKEQASQAASTAASKAAGQAASKAESKAEKSPWELKAQALREKDPKEAVKEHPDLVNAYAIIRAAELVARERFKAEADQKRFVEMTRETLARYIEHRKAIPEVAVKERSQSKVQEQTNQRETDREQAR